MKPKIIKADKESIKITWDDNSLTDIKLTTLRFLCPCAVCSADREKVGDHYLAVYQSDQITLKKITDIGNYAIKFEWADGHDTGFYEYEYLYNISVNSAI